MPDLGLIVGLGNPGPEYEHTPHNLGFLAVDRFAARNKIRITRPEGMAFAGLGTVSGKPVVAAKPQTFMNRSGGSVKLLLQKYSLGIQNLLVVYDELAFPWGQVKMFPKGSAGGHNGATSVIQSVGSNEWARLRIGCNPGRGSFSKGAGADFLLAPMRRELDKDLDEILDRAAQAIELAIAEGVEKAMTIINRRAPGSEEKA